MRNSQPLAILLGALMPLLLANPGLSDDPSKDARSKKCAELVAQLVSPNKEPITGDEAVKFPRGYDRKAQRRIDQARKALLDNFEDALPHLIDALDDQRYCMTVSWAEGEQYPNYSVGKVCRDVIASQLEVVYRDKIRFSVPRYYQYNYPVSKAWFKTRKGRSLAELQLEALDWAIERRKTEPENEGREEELVKLREFREKLAKSGKLVKSDRLMPMTLTDHGIIR